MIEREYITGLILLLMKKYNITIKTLQSVVLTEVAGESGEIVRRAILNVGMLTDNAQKKKSAISLHLSCTREGKR